MGGMDKPARISGDHRRIGFLFKCRLSEMPSFTFDVQPPSIGPLEAPPCLPPTQLITRLHIYCIAIPLSSLLGSKLQKGRDFVSFVLSCISGT